jgi:hypothetical protein
MRPDQSPEDRLREALRARVEQVEPAPDALPMIRMRTAGRRRNGWAMLGAAVAVATAVAVAVVAFVPDRGPLPLPAQSSSAGPSVPGPTSAEPPDLIPPTAAVPSTSSGQPATVELPVYYTRNGKLFREFHPLLIGADSDQHRIAAAVAESLRGSAYDPDYRTLWPDGVTVRGVAIDGRTVTVDLGDVGAGPPGDTSRLAMQQLLYTVAAASTYTSIRRVDGVRIVVDGAPVAKLWGTVDAAGTLHQAPQTDVLAPVWVIDPQQNEQVGRSFTVYLAGIVFEGTVNLRIRGAGGKVVFEQVVQLSAGAPALGEARVPVTLAPGKYTVESFFVSLKDSSVQGVDDHDFTVG